MAAHGGRRMGGSRDGGHGMGVTGEWGPSSASVCSESGSGDTPWGRRALPQDKATWRLGPPALDATQMRKRASGPSHLGVPRGRCPPPDRLWSLLSNSFLMLPLSAHAHAHGPGSLVPRALPATLRPEEGLRPTQAPHPSPREAPPSPALGKAGGGRQKTRSPARSTHSPGVWLQPSPVPLSRSFLVSPSRHV